MKTKKKLLSLLLVLVMCACLLPTTAFAQSNDTFTITYKTNAGVEMGTVPYTVGGSSNALPEISDIGSLFPDFISRARQKGRVAVTDPMWYTDPDFTQTATFPEGEAGKNYVLYCRFTTGLGLTNVNNGAPNASYSTVKDAVQPSLGVNFYSTISRSDQNDQTIAIFEKKVGENWEEVDESYYTDNRGNKWANSIWFSNVSDSGLYRLKYLRYTATDNEGNVLYYDLAYDSPEATYSVNITPVELSITDVKATDRNCDGSMMVSLTGGVLSGVLFNDEVSFDLGSGLLADTNPGSAKQVTTNIQLTGSKANNYTLIQPTDVRVTISCNSIHVAKKEATCTQSGNIEYWYCDGCGKYFRDENLTQEITQADTILPATGVPEGPDTPAHTHSFSNMWAANAAYHYHECACGAVADKAEHDFTQDIVGANNVRERVCGICGYREISVIPADPEPPQTGDGQMASLVPALLLLCGAALASAACSKRKGTL